MPSKAELEKENAALRKMLGIGSVRYIVTVTPTENSPDSVDMKNNFRMSDIDKRDLVAAGFQWISEESVWRGKANKLPLRFALAARK